MTITTATILECLYNSIQTYTYFIIKPFNTSHVFLSVLRTLCQQTGWAPSIAWFAANSTVSSTSSSKHHFPSVRSVRTTVDKRLACLALESFFLMMRKMRRYTHATTSFTLFSPLAIWRKGHFVEDDDNDKRVSLPCSSCVSSVRVSECESFC